jgi:hypothetical protein
VSGRIGPVTVLLHSPLLAAAASWGDLPGRLGGRVLVPDVTGDDTAPYAERYVADVVAQVRSGEPAADAAWPRAVVAHSGAGPLLPAVLAALRTAGLPAQQAVFLDAGLPIGCLPPPGRPVNRFDLLAAEGAAVAEALRSVLDGGGRFPNWTADRLSGLVPDPEVVLAGMRPRGADFFAEPLPDQPLPPDLSCGYVQLSPAYRGHADRAAALGWPVVRADLGHFGALAAPDDVAALIRQVSTVRCVAPGQD